VATLLTGVNLLGAGGYGRRAACDAPAVDVRLGDGAVVAIGHDLDPGTGTEVVDLGGRFVLPGLRDGHTHLAWVAQSRRSLDLEHAPSARAVAELVAQHHGQLPAGEVMWGRGFHDARFLDTPHRSLLDRAAPDRAVVLASHDGHTVWASGAALARAGMDHPTGLLREDDAFGIRRAIPLADPAVLDVAIGQVLADGAARGVTEVMDIEFEDGWSNWQRRAAAGMPVRVWAACTADGLDEAIDARRATGTVGPGLLRAGCLKLFADGALGSRTALCQHDYRERPGYRGEQMLTVDEMTASIARAHAAGITTAIHAIGDAANRNALDAFERAGVGGRIEHAQLLDRGDVGRFRELGVVASVQPSHLLDDRDIADRHWAGWTDRAYTFEDLQRAGATMEFGSDAPVAPFDPWRSIAAAVVRTEDGLPPWHPEQRVDLDTAITASTTVGALTVGAPADLVVLDEHPAGVPDADLAAIPVHATMVAGRWTHRADGGA